MPDLTIPTPRGEAMKAYLSTPQSGSGPWAGVVVIHDVFGLSAVTREHCDHLASFGYIAVAPDLYSRGGRARCVKATFQALSSGNGQAYEDIDDVRTWINDRPDSSGRSGVIGFCMGGGFALMTANRGFDTAAPNYGPLPKDLDSVFAGACPIVGSYGAKDRSLRGAAAKLESALQQRGIAHDVKEYPDANHCFLDRHEGARGAFMRVVGLRYHEPSALDAWQRIERFFAEHLGARAADGGAGT